MKKVVVCAIVAVVGFILGAGYSRMEVRKNGEDVRIDTVFIENKISVGKEELAENTTEIAPPKTIKETEDINIPETKGVEKIVKDTVYLSFPRQYYFTESNGVLIWHSGIQSRIDSLDYTERTYVIERSHQIEPSPWHFSIEIGADYIWSGHKAISPAIGFNLGYKRFTVGVEAGLALNIDNTSLAPAPYGQIGFRYSLMR